MKSLNIVLSVFLFLSLFSAGIACAANDIDIVGETTKTIKYGESASFEFIVKNNMRKVIDAIALVEGDNVGWITLDKYFFFINPSSTKTLGLTIFPQDNGTQFYTLSIQSVSEPDLYTEAILRVNAAGNKESEIIFEEKRTSMESVSAIFSANEIITEVMVDKEDENGLTVDIYLKEEDGRLISSYTEKVSGMGEHKVTKAFRAENLLAGKYIIEAVTREIVISKSAALTIPEIRDIKRTRQTTSGLFYENVIVSVENKGNVIEREYVLKETVPVTEYVTWDYEPIQTDVIDGNIDVYWKFGSMRPKDKVMISYTIHYWYSFLRLVVGILLILAAIGIFYMKLSKPSIKKKIIKKGTNKYLVILEVKGSFFTSLKSVLVKDYLSPLVHIEGKFEGISPVVKKNKDKTELLWRIGRIKRSDEIILSYNIKSVVEAQIKLPPAMMRFKKTEEGEKRRIYSAEMMLE